MSNGPNESPGTVGFYRASVADYRREASERHNRTLREYWSLKNKKSAFAKQVAAVARLHASVEAVWANAPDEVEHHGKEERCAREITAGE